MSGFGKKFRWYPSLKWSPPNNLATWVSFDPSQDGRGFVPTPHINLRFTADFENVGQGYLWYGQGYQPRVLMEPVGTEPTCDWPGARRGFRLLVMIEGEEEAREITSDNDALWHAFGVLYDRWKAEAPAHPGELPVLEHRDATGTGYRCKPRLEIIAHRPRPEALPDVAPQSQTALMPTRAGKDTSSDSNVSSMQQRNRAAASGGSSRTVDMDDEIPF
jgi:hypothetical protein